MKCPNCNEDVNAGEQFCLACGTEMPAVAPTPAPAPAVAQTPATPPITAPQPVPPSPSAPSTPVVVTLSFGGKDFPLVEGDKLVIARADTDKCAPSIGIASDTVSSTPVEVTVVNGVVTVKDTGTSTGIRVVKYINPGASIDVAPGDMLMLGDQVVTIG